MQSETIQQLARDCGFELAGVAAAERVPETGRFQQWVRDGFAGEMHYLKGRRAEIRSDPRLLLPSARSVICVGKLYNGPEPHSDRFRSEELAWISRYAWGDDYHDILRAGLALLVEKLHQHLSFEWKICVDTAPLLERAYARHAGLGWIGKNTCLINQQAGSWFFLGELLVSFDVQPDAPPPDRCGTCRRCIDACPTQALTPYVLDSRLCISYFTIELRGDIPEEMRAGMGNHVFGCDICQEVCPWNRRAPISPEPAFRPRSLAPPLEKLAGLSEREFREMFRSSPVTRARYSGFLRNVAIAMGNQASRSLRAPLEKLAQSPDPLVAGHARWGLDKLR